MNSFNFEKLDMPKQQLKMLCDGTLLIYIKCINRFNIQESNHCFNDFKNAFNCLKILDKKEKK